MKVLVFSIYDLKTRVFFPPMVYHNAEHAKRDMMLELRKGGMMKEFPGDYELYQIGEFHDDTANIEKMVPPIRVCRLDELMPRSPAVEATGVLPFPGQSTPPTQVVGGGR